MSCGAMKVACDDGFSVVTSNKQELVAMVKSSKTARGYDEILVAGDPEWRAEELRSSQGMPLSEGAWQGLAAAAQQLGVALPG